MQIEPLYQNLTLLNYCQFVMDNFLIIGSIGFILAAYSVVGNDVIQTLGTFLTSNSKRPWYVLWAFAAVILTFTLVYGWYTNGGDMSYGRLLGEGGFDNPRYPYPTSENWYDLWYYVLPPVILVIITRMGIPVSTTFMILTIFGSSSTMLKVIEKSVFGYVVAFFAGMVIYLAITRLVEKKFIETKDMEGRMIRLGGLEIPEMNVWMVLQWFSTGWLWYNWLIQDLANIYVFLPRKMGELGLILTLVLILGLLAYIFATSGGAIQKIVTSKTNTADIRAATIIDFVYAFVVFFFKELNDIPMSTTWVFIGLLTGREYAINLLLNRNQIKLVNRMALSDLGKTFLGLVISVGLVFLIKWLAGDPMTFS